jgi:hypothetical protein
MEIEKIRFTDDPLRKPIPVTPGSFRIPLSEAYNIINAPPIKHVADDKKCGCPACGEK